MGNEGFPVSGDCKYSHYPLLEIHLYKEMGFVSSERQKTPEHDVFSKVPQKVDMLRAEGMNGAIFLDLGRIGGPCILAAV